MQASSVYSGSFPLRQSVPGVCRRVVLSALFVLCALLASCIDGADKQNRADDDLVHARKAMMQREFLEAEKSFERYLRRNPEGKERWEVWNSLVDISLSVRNARQSAIELLEAMFLEYEDDQDKKRRVSTRLAELYRLSRNYARAVYLWSSIAEDAAASNNERAEACRNLAHVYMRRLEFELAKKSLGDCLALDIPVAVRSECLYDLAQTYVGMDELDNAIEQLRFVLALQGIPESMRTLTIFMLADAVEQQGKNAEAMELFTSISNAYPNRKVVEERIEELQKRIAAKAAEPQVKRK